MCCQQVRLENPHPWKPSLITGTPGVFTQTSTRLLFDIKLPAAVHQSVQR